MFSRIKNAAFLVSIAASLGVQAYTGGSLIYSANIRPDDLFEFTRWEFGNVIGALILLNTSLVCVVLWPFRSTLYQLTVETFSNVKR